MNLPLPKSIDTLLNHLNNLEVKLSKNPLIGLCHNDLNASNIILSNDNLYFVDYEYSSMGDVFFDLATISWFFNERSRKNLLELYFNECTEQNGRSDVAQYSDTDLLHPCHYRWSCADFHALCGIEDRA